MLDALGTVGNVLDMPGSYLRGALAGRFGERASGRELLNTYGLSDENDPWGGVKGFGAEMVLDPLSLAAPALGAIKGLRGIQAGTRAAQALSHSDDANPLVKAMAGFAGDESGALRPFMEIGRRTDPDYINSVPWWHGTATPGLTPETLDPMKTDPGGLFGRGVYKTADPNIAGGPEGYAFQRMGQAARQWADNSGDTIRKMMQGKSSQIFDPQMGLYRLKREIPPELHALSSELSGIFEGPNAGLIDPGVRQYIKELQMSSRPERALPEAFSRAGEVPEIGRQLAPLAKQHGLNIAPYPEQTVYEANTNLGKIMDLDAPAPPELMDLWREHSSGPPPSSFNPAGFGLFQLGEPDGTASGIIEALASRQAGSGTVPHHATDPLIQSLRGMGYDALSHTGGLRAGGGRNLHQVLISLDPNDTISHVGRAGQITRFEPQDIPELLKRFGGT